MDIRKLVAVKPPNSSHQERGKKFPPPVFLPERDKGGRSGLKPNSDKTVTNPSLKAGVMALSESGFSPDKEVFTG